MLGLDYIMLNNWVNSQNGYLANLPKGNNWVKSYIPIGITFTQLPNSYIFICKNG